MSKVKVLADCVIEVDPPSHIYRWARDVEDQARLLQEWIDDFHSFIRDHRSQDPVYLSVKRIYEEKCEHCRYIWDVDADGVPQCCNKAQEEFAANIEATDKTSN